ncbi:MAG: TonB-dependent receptor plug domain-containing protein [Alphaproteobacteria bacterium]
MRALACAVALVCCTQPALAQSQIASIWDLRELSIEELANLEITSVAKQRSPLQEAPASVYVVTGEEIRRSGANSVPEALRLAPNLQVARLNAATYAITARGFNHETATANKLLVLIDGRTVYTPLYSGVFWDTQSVMLADIDRIEVISGPGGALWGTNAVNGVINIITRPADQTAGVHFDAGYGNLDKVVNARFGGALGEDASFRIYAMGEKRGPLETPDGKDAKDDWQKLQGGFRADFGEGASTFTLQGDIYAGESEHVPAGSVSENTLSGGNLLGRWVQRFSDGSNLQLQAYYDNARRTTISGITSLVSTYDMDVHYAFRMGERHAFVVGGGYRYIEDKFTPGPATAFLDPAERTLELANVFVHDQVALQPDLTLSLGVKLETNSYTGLEYMPEARLAWLASETSMLWVAVARAVRTPSRVDRDLYVTGLLAGGPDFVSEDLIATEVGYRGQPAPNFSLSASVFFNVYDDLRTVEATGAPFPLVVKNNMEGETYGAEAWAVYDATDWWRLRAGVSTLHKDLELKKGSTDFFGTGFAGNDPEYQISLRSAMDFGDIELDLGLRAIDALPGPSVPAYVEADARIGWHLSETMDLSLLGANLLHERHLEFVSSSLPRREVPRSFFVSFTWRP